MLKNRYQEILVGMGLMSLVRGIISLKRNQTTLLIDDKRFTVDSYPGHFLSELEVLCLIRLGKKHDIPELIDLRQFLVNANIEMVLENSRLRLGRGPLQNLKELLRKYPELIDESDLDLVYKESDEEFNRYFLSELVRYETQNYEASMRPKGYHFELQGPKWLQTVYKRLGELLNQEYQDSGSLKYSGLLHLMGLSFEEKLKTQLGAEEIPFYFFRTLSPVYRLHDFFLASQLKRRLILLGGDYKESTVQFWQFHENKFENLLLASFEGVISGDRVLFFSHLPEQVPFQIRSSFQFLRKGHVQPSKRLSSPFPPAELTYMADTKLLGSERPYRVMAKANEFTYYHWPFPELPGTKLEFYQKELEVSFEQDSKGLPFEHGHVEVSHSGSVTLDLRTMKADKKHEAPVLKRLPIEISQEERAIKGFEYWGLFRYRSFGLLSLSYGIESF